MRSRPVRRERPAYRQIGTGRPNRRSKVAYARLAGLGLSERRLGLWFRASRAPQGIRGSDYCSHESGVVSAGDRAAPDSSAPDFHRPEAAVAFVDLRGRQRGIRA
jgi:hypothetical protein